MNSITEIAEIAHEAYRVYCRTLGDYSQTTWIYCPQWQRDSAINGARAIERSVVINPEESHQNWLNTKHEEGWKHGSKKDPYKKLHPCMVAFASLPHEQQMKDRLFFTVVSVLLGR